jgi:hypothetical protein
MATDIEKIKEEFLQTVSSHKMTVECDKGVHRCIHFANPDCFNGWFHLITWPGGLTIAGDYGAYSFTRINDMFQFFRSAGEQIQIKPDYWEQKLISTDRVSSHEKFSCEGNEFHIQEAYRNYAKEESCAEEREYARQELRSAFDSAPESLEQLYDTLGGLENDSIRGELSDALYDISLTAYTTRFIWCLWAIVWGIREYDRATAGSKAA